MFYFRDIPCLRINNLGLELLKFFKMSIRLNCIDFYLKKMKT